ncbi:MAG: DUF5063 domain-containing protein [Candidatus Sumerlaeia bacterium]
MSEAFLKAAANYCAWAESIADDVDAETRKALELLNDLYTEALKLGVPEKVESGLAETSISDSEWQDKYIRFANLHVKRYSSIYNPLEIPPEYPVVNDMPGDLASIYRDIADGMHLHVLGKDDAAFDHWSRTFRKHWGRHAIEAIHALHCYFTNENRWS